MIASFSNTPSDIPPHIKVCSVTLQLLWHGCLWNTFWTLQQGWSQWDFHKSNIEGSGATLPKRKTGPCEARWIHVVPHTGAQLQPPCEKMLNRVKDHREQRPQLCGAQTGELKTGPWAGNKTLEHCRNAEHSESHPHTMYCHSKWCYSWTFSSRHQTGQRSRVWNKRTLMKLVECVSADTEKVQNRLDGEKLCKGGTVGGNSKKSVLKNKADCTLSVITQVNSGYNHFERASFRKWFLMHT